MRLRTQRVRSGDWIVVTHAHDPRSVAPETIHIDGAPHAAFVDGTSLMVRARGLSIGQHSIRVRGIEVGRVQVEP